MQQIADEWPLPRNEQHRQQLNQATDLKLAASRLRETLRRSREQRTLQPTTTATP